MNVENLSPAMMKAIEAGGTNNAVIGGSLRKRGIMVERDPSRNPIQETKYILSPEYIESQKPAVDPIEDSSELTETDRPIDFGPAPSEKTVSCMVCGERWETVGESIDHPCFTEKHEEPAPSEMELPGMWETSDFTGGEVSEETGANIGRTLAGDFTPTYHTNNPCNPVPAFAPEPEEVRSARMENERARRAASGAVPAFSITDEIVTIEVEDGTLEDVIERDGYAEPVPAPAHPRHPITRKPILRTTATVRNVEPTSAPPAIRSIRKHKSAQPSSRPRKFR